MRALVITSHEGPDALEFRDMPQPVPRDDEVLIGVRAAGVSFPELLQTRGLYQDSPELPFIPGLEVAGTVVQCAEGGRFAVGDQVIAIPGRGGLAEFAVCPVTRVFALPKSLEPSEGVAIPLNFFTAYFAVTKRARMREGETVLVHGAAGGLGTALVSVAAALGGTVVALVSTAEKAETARRAGAHTVVVASDDWRQAVMEASAGVDVVFDPVGGDRAVDSLRVLKSLGRYVVLGFTAGSIPEIRVNRLLLRNLDVVGAGWGAFVWGDPVAFREIAEGALDLVEAGKASPIVGTRLPFGEAADAFRVIEGRRALGKVVVEMP